MSDGASTDLAGTAYWEDLWRRGGNRRFGRFSYFQYVFGRLLRRYIRPGMRVCEVGCADSIWLPLLSSRGFDVTGLDYSQSGVDRLRHRLEAAGLKATVVCGDLFDDPLTAGSFDVVFTLGLVEHFADAQAVLARLQRLLRPQGVLVTIIPNLAGAWGVLQRRLDYEIFSVHVPYRAEQLDEIHLAAGLLCVEQARYFGIFGPLILNSGALRRRWPRLNGPVQAALWIAQQTVSWTAAGVLGDRANTRYFASHVVGIYRNR